jgi:hypothetical protein
MLRWWWRVGNNAGIVAKVTHTNTLPHDTICESDAE